MLPADAFWAVRIIARFTDEMIGAVVETGELTHPKSAQYLTQTLIKRRDKILHHYLGRMLALDNFRLRGEARSEIVFDDLRQEASLPAPPAYGYRWFSFRNEDAQRAPLDASGQASPSGAVTVPASQEEFLIVRLSDTTTGIPGYVEVFLRNAGVNSTIVGIDRQFE